MDICFTYHVLSIMFINHVLSIMMFINHILNIWHENIKSLENFNICEQKRRRLSFFLSATKKANPQRNHDEKLPILSLTTSQVCFHRMILLVIFILELKTSVARWVQKSGLKIVGFLNTKRAILLALLLFWVKILSCR